MEENKVSTTTGQWLGWIGIVLAIIGFFWQPVWMGVIALILGIVGLFSDQKALIGQQLFLL